jgi:hypothetical protein
MSARAVLPHATWPTAIGSAHYEFRLKGKTYPGNGPASMRLHHPIRTLQRLMLTGACDVLEAEKRYFALSGPIPAYGFFGSFTLSAISM